VSEIVENSLGWDITDFGLGDFAKFGLFLFTLRNGSPNNLASGKGKLYAEKIMVVENGQVTPLHFHWFKMEDIINRGGGNLVIELYNATSDDLLDETTPVRLKTDGVERIIEPGGQGDFTTRRKHLFRAEDLSPVLWGNRAKVKCW